MSDLKKRIKVIEEKLKPEDKDIAELEEALQRERQRSWWQKMWKR